MMVAFSQVHKVCGVRPQPFSKIFSWPIKAKFHVEPPWEGGTKVYINGLGNMTKMAATPIVLSFFLSILSRSNFDHHLRCGGWPNFEFS